MGTKIILVDGISGAGKGQAVQFISQYLETLGYKPKIVREPSMFIRDIIRAYKERNVRDAQVEAFLFTADRKQLCLEEIKPYLENDEKHIIISDRSFLSTAAYQSLTGFPMQKIFELNASFYPKDHAAFILLCSPEEAVKRIMQASREYISPDETITKISRLRDQYLNVAEALKYPQIIHTDTFLSDVHKEYSEEVVHWKLRAQINRLFNIPMEKAVFLDKDGTLVENGQYPEVIPSDDIWFDKTVHGLKRLQDEGYKLIIQSSQPWVARGRMTLEEVEQVFKSVVEQYAQHGVTIDAYYYCPHNRKEDDCVCKKPKPGLLYDAAKRYNIDPFQSFVIGDMKHDMGVGKVFGCRSIGVGEREELKGAADVICVDVNAAADYIIGEETVVEERPVVENIIEEKEEDVSFPLVDAFLENANEEGFIGICSNFGSPALLLNELGDDMKKSVAAVGRLVVNRDGAERVIVNSLAHPNVRYLILFGNETLSFMPSTNLLLALVNGYRSDKPGNYIINGRGIAHQYPSISTQLLQDFKERVIVLPAYTKEGSEEIVKAYIERIKDSIPQELYECLVEINQKKKVYFDGLKKLITILQQLPQKERAPYHLDPKDFQRLQPPVTFVDGEEQQFTVPFEVKVENNFIVVKVDTGEQVIVTKGKDSWNIACTLQKQQIKSLSTLQELLLGCSLSFAEIALKSQITVGQMFLPNIQSSEIIEVPVDAKLALRADKKYYYKILQKDNVVRVQALTHLLEEDVFELQSEGLTPLIKEIAKHDRFDDYDLSFLHKVDVGVEIARAVLATKKGMQFIQDFRNLFLLNTETFPYLEVEGSAFANVHKDLILSLYTKGLDTGHPDNYKGPMRSACVLTVYRRAEKALEVMPSVYAQGTMSTTEMREAYKNQLLSTEGVAEHSYTYGNRTRAHFGYDQMEQVVQALKENPKYPAVMQRTDYVQDMSLREVEVRNDAGEVTGKRIEESHDPCLSHDIYFVFKGKLYSFHIARAHNIVNAYPENVFGLFDAYDKNISKATGIPLGDMFMLSNRANILLVSEEQKAQSIIGQSAIEEESYTKESGPFSLEEQSEGLTHYTRPLQVREERIAHPCLDRLENYRGMNIIDKAIFYLKTQGAKHNNATIGSYDPANRTDLVKERLVFFQCNERAGTLHATAVFLTGNGQVRPYDEALCDYIVTKYSKTLGLSLGELQVFYMHYKE